MIYLVHPSGAFAACEDAAHAEPYERQGYLRCSLDAFVAAWRAQDLRRMDALGLLPVYETAPLKAGTIVTRLAEWTHYDARGRKVQ